MLRGLYSADIRGLFLRCCFLGLILVSPAEVRADAPLNEKNLPTDYGPLPWNQKFVTGDIADQSLLTDPALSRDARILFLTLKAVGMSPYFGYAKPILPNINRSVYSSPTCYYASLGCQPDKYVIISVCNNDSACLLFALKSLSITLKDKDNKNKNNLVDYGDYYKQAFMDDIFTFEYAKSLLNKMIVEKSNEVRGAFADWYLKVIKAVKKNDQKSLVEKTDYNLAMRTLLKPSYKSHSDIKLWSDYLSYDSKQLMTDVIDISNDESIMKSVFGDDTAPESIFLRKNQWLTGMSLPSKLLYHGMIPRTHASHVVDLYFKEGYGRKVICFTDQSAVSEDCKNKLSNYVSLIGARYNTKLSSMPKLDSISSNSDGKFWRKMYSELLQPMSIDSASSLDLVQYVHKTNQVVHSVNDILSEYWDFQQYVRAKNLNSNQKSYYGPSSNDLKSQILDFYDAILHGKVPVSPFLALSFLKIEHENLHHCEKFGSDNCRVRFVLDPDLRIWSTIMYDNSGDSNSGSIHDGYTDIQFRTDQQWFNYLVFELLRRRKAIEDKLKNYDCNHQSGVCISRNSKNDMMMSSSNVLSLYKPHYSLDDVFVLQNLDRKIIGGFKDLINTYRAEGKESIGPVNLIHTALQTACMLDDTHYSRIEKNDGSLGDHDLSWHMHYCVTKSLVPNHVDYESFAYLRKDLVPLLQRLILQRRFWVSIPLAIDTWKVSRGNANCDNFQKCLMLGQKMFKTMRILGNEYELVFYLMRLNNLDQDKNDILALQKLRTQYQEHTKTILPEVWGLNGLRKEAKFDDDGYTSEDVGLTSSESRDESHKTDEEGVGVSTAKETDQETDQENGTKEEQNVKKSKHHRVNRTKRSTNNKQDDSIEPMLNINIKDQEQRDSSAQVYKSFQDEWEGDGPRAQRLRALPDYSANVEPEAMIVTNHESEVVSNFGKKVRDSADPVLPYAFLNSMRVSKAFGRLDWHFWNSLLDVYDTEDPLFKDKAEGNFQESSSGGYNINAQCQTNVKSHLRLVSGSNFLDSRTDARDKSEEAKMRDVYRYGDLNIELPDTRGYRINIAECVLNFVKTSKWDNYEWLYGVQLYTSQYNSVGSSNPVSNNDYKSWYNELLKNWKGSNKNFALVGLKNDFVLAGSAKLGIFHAFNENFGMGMLASTALINYNKDNLVSIITLLYDEEHGYGEVYRNHELYAGAMDLAPGVVTSFKMTGDDGQERTAQVLNGRVYSAYLYTQLYSITDVQVFLKGGYFISDDSGKHKLSIQAIGSAGCGGVPWAGIDQLICMASARLQARSSHVVGDGIILSPFLRISWQYFRKDANGMVYNMILDEVNPLSLGLSLEYGKNKFTVGLDVDHIFSSSQDMRIFAEIGIEI